MNLNDYRSQGWKIVSYAADCIQSDEWVGTDEPGDLCSRCLLDYVNECQCPGPTQDDMEYEYFGDILIARQITDKNHS